MPEEQIDENDDIIINRAPEGVGDFSQLNELDKMKPATLSRIGGIILDKIIEPAGIAAILTTVFEISTHTQLEKLNQFLLTLPADNPVVTFMNQIDLNWIKSPAGIATAYIFFYGVTKGIESLNLLISKTNKESEQ